MIQDTLRYKDIISIWGRTKSHLWRNDEGQQEVIPCACLTRSDVTGSHVTFPLTFFFLNFFPSISFLVLFFPVPFFPVFFPLSFFSSISFPVPFFPQFVFPYFFPRTFSNYFSPRTFSHYFFPVLFRIIFFPVFFTPYFFFRTFPIILFPVLPLPSPPPVLFFPVLFPMSQRLKSNVLKYQLVVFLEHVVITLFMFLAEYPFKRQRRASLEGWGADARSEGTKNEFI